MSTITTPLSNFIEVVTLPPPGVSPNCAACQQETPRKLSLGGAKIVLCFYCGTAAARAFGYLSAEESAALREETSVAQTEARDAREAAERAQQDEALVAEADKVLAGFMAIVEVAVSRGTGTG
ncbi:MAG TPA: hypothetical protein VNI55_01795 [Gaiellaceae bacterium]|nr:hypothetical protein [Gaiellaceae bacterium]